MDSFFRILCALLPRVTYLVCANHICWAEAIAKPAALCVVAAKNASTIKACGATNFAVLCSTIVSLFHAHLTFFPQNLSFSFSISTRSRSTDHSFMYVSSGYDIGIVIHVARHIAGVSTSNSISTQSVSFSQYFSKSL